MRLIDADAFDRALADAQDECRKNGGNFRYGVLNTVRGNLAKMPTVGGWVSVKDRMPELEGDYLVTDGHKVPWISRMMKIAGVKGWVNGALNPSIKYWMPFPELPKEGKRYDCL